MEDKRYFVVSTTCNHSVCYDCFREIFQKQHELSEYKCSFCRQKVLFAEVVPEDASKQKKISQLLSRKHKRRLRASSSAVQHIEHADEALLRLFANRFERANL